MKNNKPTHRVSFARIERSKFKDDDKVGSAREIGAIWPRENGKGSILRFDHIPVELTRHEGVLFINEISPHK